MNASPPRTAERHPRRRLAFAFVSAWIFFLAGLALWTANPVTLNIDQLLLARATGAVVMATVTDVKSGRCRVDEVLEKAAAGDLDIEAGQEISVSRLLASGAKTGERVILPLLPGDQAGWFEVAPTRFHSTPSYPATPEMVEQVSEILARK